MEASPQAAAWKVVVRALGDFVPSRGLPSNHELAEALSSLQSTPLHTVLVEWMLERTRVELAAHAVPSFWAHWRRLAPSSHQAGDVTPHEVHHRCQLAMFDAVHEIRTCVVAQLRTLRLVERANAVAPSPMDTGEITAYEAGSAGARLLAGLPALLISAAPSEAAFGTWMTMCWERSFHDWREVRRSGAPETASDDPWISFGDCDGDDDASDSDGDGGGGAGGGGGGRGGGVGGAAGKDDGMAVDEGGRAGSAAARRLQRLRPFCEELHELSWLPLSEATLSSMLHGQLRAHLHRRCEGRTTEPMLDRMLRWLNATVFPWLRVVLQPSAACAAPVAALERWQARLRFFFLQLLASLRIGELFELIRDYPETLPAIEDLRECLRHTQQHEVLVARLRTALESRLLKPGVDTSNIIQVCAASPVFCRSALLFRSHRPARTGPESGLRLRDQGAAAP